MFSYVAVKIELERFVEVCKVLFINFEDDSEQYISKKKEEGEFKNEDRNSLMIDFLSEKSNHYFNASLDDHYMETVIFEWWPEERGTKPRVVFGVSLLCCEKDTNKSLNWKQVEERVEAVKVLISHFDVSDDQIEFMVQNF
jgi:hypothetical protein